MVENTKTKSKIRTLSSFILTMLVVGFLIIAGPASAVQLHVGASESAPDEGEWITLTGHVDIDDNERIPFSDMDVIVEYMNGTEITSCFYDMAGNAIDDDNDNSTEDDCPTDSFRNIDVTYNYLDYDLGSANFTGYGYGYGFSPDIIGVNQYNRSFDGGYGYGYGVGYGYGSGFANPSEIQTTIEYKTPDNFDSATNIRIRFKATGTGDDGRRFYFQDQSSLGIQVQDTTETVDNSTETVTFTNASTFKAVSIPTTVPATQTVKLNLSGVQDFATKKVTISTNFTLERKTTNASVSYKVEIPQNTQIDGGSSWDGIIELPKVKSDTSSLALSGASGSVNLAIDLGSVQDLTFSAPVKLTLGGMANKKAAWSRTGQTTMTVISTVCNSATAPTNVPANGECYISSGNDLIIWTYHFTTFAAYTATTPTSTSGGSSGSNAKTYSYENQLSAQNAIGQTIKEDDKIKFQHRGEQHSFQLNDIDYDNKQIDATISSDPIDLTMDENIVYLVDSDANGFADLKTWFTFLSSTRTTVYLEAVDEDTTTPSTGQVTESPTTPPVVPSENVDQGTVEDSTTQPVVDTTTTDASTQPEEPTQAQPVDEGSNTWLYITIAIVLLIIIGLGVFFYMRREDL